MVSIKLNGEHHPYFFKCSQLKYLWFYLQSLSLKKKKKEPQDYKKSPVNMSNKLSVNCYTHSYVALIYLNKIKSLGSESFDSDWINISPRLLRDMLWWT